jgi:hypothetical protein
VIIEVGYYLFGIALYFLFFLGFVFEKKSTVAKAGRITFFGDRAFVADCLKAIDQELPKYDPALRRLLCDGNIHLAIYDQNMESDKMAKKLSGTVEAKSMSKQTLYSSNLAAGLYGVPETIWRRGPEGICQLIVYRYFQSTELGQGMAAAIRLSDFEFRRTSLIRAREHMRKWLIEVGYPPGWIDYYPMQRPINPPSATPGRDTSRPSC